MQIHKLCKIQFWKNLVAIGFPNKHCNLTALPTLQVGVENRDKPYSISHRELCGGDSTRPHLSGHGYWRQYYQTTLRQLLSSVSWNEVVPPGLVSLFSYSIVSAWKWLERWLGLDHFIVRITFLMVNTHIEFLVLDLIFLPRGREFDSNFWENVKIPPYAPPPPRRLDIDRCITSILCGMLLVKMKAINEFLNRKLKASSQFLRLHLCTRWWFSSPITCSQSRECHAFATSYMLTHS